MELARLIGQTDPFTPMPGSASESGKPEGRLADISRSVTSGSMRRDAQAVLPRVPLQSTHPDTDHFETPRAGESFVFLQLPSRDEYPVAPRQAQADDGDYHHEELLMARRHSAYGQQDEHHDYDHEYREDEYGQDGDYEYEAEHEDSDDDEPGSKRRSTTKVVIAVLGLAVFGSAAAFGYRTIFKAAPSGPTPIIRADSSPTKVTPTGTDANPKPIYERLDDRSSERLVRRDEEPVDIGASYRSGATGAVSASGPFSDTSSSPPPATVPASTGPGALAGAKSVRTITIPADQGVTAPAERAVPVPPAPRAVVAPLRQAAVLPPPAASAAPMAAAPETATPRANEAGGFVVQLSAQRSEAEAQTAFRTLQTKYSVLSGRQPLIRYKDLGEKGIFYAAQVGPFGVKSDADQLCETLKSAGGSCFVQKN